MELFGDLERLLAQVYPLRIPIALGTLAIGVALLVLAYRRGWHHVILEHRRASATVTVVALLVGGPLSYYLASPLFISTKVVEALPVSAAANDIPIRVSGDAGSVALSSGASASTAAQNPNSGSSTGATAMPVVQRGELKGADAFHFGRGQALIVQVAPGRHVLRLDDFSVRNGPDLFVYLSSNPNGYASDAINLGRLRANDGSLNYEIPDTVDLSRVKSAVIWCRQFAVLFATATLSA